PTPGEQLVWGDAMPTSHQAYRHTQIEGLFDHANLLRGRPAPPTLNRRDNLNAIGRIGHRHGCMPHTCQVADRVRSVRGLSHSWRQIDVAMADFRGAKRKRCVSYFTLRWWPKNARWPKTLCELATCLGVGLQDHKDRLLFRSKQLSCVVG